MLLATADDVWLLLQPHFKLCSARILLLEHYWEHGGERNALEAYKFIHRQISRLLRPSFIWEGKAGRANPVTIKMQLQASLLPEAAHYNARNQLFEGCPSFYKNSELFPPFLQINY